MTGHYRGFVNHDEKGDSFPATCVLLKLVLRSLTYLMEEDGLLAALVLDSGMKEEYENACLQNKRITILESFCTLLHSSNIGKSCPHDAVTLLNPAQLTFLLLAI